MSAPVIPPPGDENDTTQPQNLLADLRPFGDDIRATWRGTAVSAPLHECALEELYTLGVEGRIVMLSAPRAGHGKTHLIGRVAEKLTGEATMIALPWQSEEGLTWLQTGRGLLQDLAGGTARPAELQRLGAGVNTTLLRRLIQTGRIPSTDPAQALKVLSEDPMDIFSETGNAKVIGDWFRRHADQLRGQLAEISNVEGSEEVEACLKGLFDYMDTPTPAVLNSLISDLESDAAGQVTRLLKLAASWRPVVLVADHMDALYRDVDAGIAIARMALELTEIPGVHVVLSMNQDLWDTTFGRQLPSALEDRLSACHVSLSGLLLEDAEALISLRLREAGVNDAHQTSFLKFLDLEPYMVSRPYGSVSARALLRHAAVVWRSWVQVQDRPQPGSIPQGLDNDDSDQTGGDEPEPLPMMPDDSEEDLSELAKSLAADAGGKVVDIANNPGTVEIPKVDLVPSPPPFPGAGHHSDNGTGTSGGPVAEFKPAPPATGGGLGANYHKLRQMLAKLKVTGEATAVTSSSSAEAAAPESSVQVADEHEPAPEPLLADDDAEESLTARFERLRAQILQAGDKLQVDQPALALLLKLAGKRFPVVNYDELELPGLLGRSLPRWSLQGMELVFGLDDFTDVRYWKTVSGFVAGRLAELHNGSQQNGDSGPHLKLVVFKGEHEGEALLTLLQNEVIPTTLRPFIDAVHLDPRSLASLSAMRQIIQDAETGALKSEPTAVLGALANELDFFWKRITRPKS